jgi:hypothetical protein
MPLFDQILEKLQASKDEIDLVNAKLGNGERWRIGHPMEIIMALDAKLPVDWTEWEPSVLFKRVEGIFGTLNEITRQKMLAIQVARTTDRPWHDWDVFENTCLAFCGQIPLWGELEPLDLHEMAFGMGCLDDIRPEEYGDDVQGYIATTLVYNSLYMVPPSLPDVGSIVDRLMPEARDLVRQTKQSWDAGVRLESVESDPIDALEAQLQKVQLVEDWYLLGRNYNDQLLYGPERSQ